METDSRVLWHLGDHGHTSLGKGEGAGITDLTSPTYPEALKGDAFPLGCPRKRTRSPWEWLERRTEVSGQQREPGPRPGTLPALGALGAREAGGGSAPSEPSPRRAPAPPGLAAPRAAVAPLLPPGCSSGRAGSAQPFVPASSPSLRVCCAPAPRGPQSAQRRSLRIVAFYCFLSFFVVSSRSEAKSENLRWSPRARRAKPGLRGRGAGGVGAPPEVGAFSCSQGIPRPQPCTI